MISQLPGGHAEPLFRVRGLYHVLVFVVLAVGGREEEQEEPQLHLRDSLGKRLRVIRGDYYHNISDLLNGLHLDCFIRDFVEFLFRPTMKKDRHDEKRTPQCP